MEGVVAAGFVLGSIETDLVNPARYATAGEERRKSLRRSQGLAPR